MVMRAYKYRLYPTKTQDVRLEQSLETHRRLYNDALAERKTAWESEKRTVHYAEQSKALTLRRKSNTWLAAESISAEQRTLRRLDKAFAAFFRRVKQGTTPGYPRFKGRGRFESIEYTYGSGVGIRHDRLYVQHNGEIRVRLDRPVRGTIKAAALKREADGWYVVFYCDIGEPSASPSTKPSVGIDLGLKSFLVTSDEKTVVSPGFYRSAERKLHRAQRRVARRKKGSSRRRKAIKALARVHQRISRQRADFHHRTVKQLVGSYGAVYHEHLNVKGIGKSRLAKSTHDAGWGQFLFFLAYKAEEAGVRVVAVNPRNTTQVCSNCGALPDERLTLRDRIYHCQHCGYVADRDLNAARNIHSLGNGATLVPQSLSTAIAGLG